MHKTVKLSNLSDEVTRSNDVIILERKYSSKTHTMTIQEAIDLGTALLELAALPLNQANRDTQITYDEIDSGDNDTKWILHGIGSILYASHKNAYTVRLDDQFSSEFPTFEDAEKYLIEQLETMAVDAKSEALQSLRRSESIARIVSRSK